MLTLQDCIALSNLTEEEIEAIAEHEHLPEIVATEMGAWLTETPNGEIRIRGMIVDDIEKARTRGDFVHSAKLKLVLKQYCKEHAAAATAE